MLRRTWCVLVGVLALSGSPAWAQQPADQPPPEDLPTAEPIVEPIAEDAVAEPAEAEPPVAEPVEAEPVEAEPVEAEPAEAEPAEADEPPPIEWGGADETAEEKAEEAAALAENAGDDVPGDMTTEQAEKDPGKYAAHLREVIKAVKKSVMAKMEKQMAAKQAAKLSTIFTILFYVSFGGFLLLLMPLFLARKYPGKGGLLFKYSGMAAMTAFVAINLFALVLLFLRTTQGQMSSFTNPKLAIISASFDSIDDMAADQDNQEMIASLGPQFIEPMLERLSGDTEDDLPVVLMEKMAESPLAENIKQLENDIGVFKSVGSFFKSISWLFAMVPIVLTLLAVMLFLVAIKPTLMEIVQMPARAAQGAQGLGAQMTRLVFSRVVRELAATLCLLGVLFCVVLLSSSLLYQSVKPAVDSLISYIIVAFMYLLSKEGASSGMIFFSLAMIMVFLVLNLAVMIVSSAFFLGKSQKIFQQRFQDRIPLGAHKRFWTWGTASLLLAQVFPLLFILAARPGVELLQKKFFAGDEPGWGKVMVLVPLILVVGFLVLFWAARGLKALGFLFKYKPKQVAAALAAASAAYPQPGFAPPFYPGAPQPGFGPAPLLPGLPPGQQPPPGGPWPPPGDQSF